MCCIKCETGFWLSRYNNFGPSESNLTTIVLLWSGSLFADYEIQIKERDQPFRYLGVAGKNTTSYKVGDVSPNKEYHFRVRKKMGGVSSPWKETSVALL